MIDPYASPYLIHSPHQNHEGLAQAVDAQPSVLYVFSPRPFTMQVRRPLTYQFHDRFVAQVCDELHNGRPNSDAKIRHLLSNPSSYNVVLPADVTGGIMRAEYLGQFWTFLLIVNGEQPRRPLTAAGFGDVAPANYFANSSLMSNRAIYYGYCMDEPINQLTMGRSGTPTVNPNCRMVITHKTYMHQHSGWGSRGLLAPRFDVIANTDVIDPGLLNMISAEPLHQLTPQKLLEDVDTSYDPYGGKEHYIIHTPGSLTPITAAHPVFGIDARLSEPRENLKQILNNAAHANEAVLASERMGPLGGANVTDDLMHVGGRDLWTETLIDRFNVASPGSEMGLQENELVNMSLIMQRYHPEIQPYLIERATQWDVMDQTIRSPANIFSAMVMQAAPVLLTSAGLAEIAMAYDSYNNTEQVYSVSHMASVAEVEKAAAVRAFLFTIKSQLFEIIKTARGDFNIQLSLQSSGMSHCVLNFYCDNEVNRAPFEVPTIAGGLNSNLVGSMDMAAQNGEALALFTDQLAGVGEQAVPGFNYE